LLLRERFGGEEVEQSFLVMSTWKERELHFTFQVSSCLNPDLVIATWDSDDSASNNQESVVSFNTWGRAGVSCGCSASMRKS
jgi:hypothetical protein